MKYILITGFDATLGGLDNPAASVALNLRHLPGTKIAILPTVYDTCEQELHRLLDTSTRQPSLAGVILLGQASRQPAIYLETQAKNSCSPTRQDGMKQVGPTPIVAKGPDCYRSTLPISTVVDRLEGETIPVTTSSNAGDYLCNYAAYLTAHIMRDESIPHGFVHIPSADLAEPQEYEPGGWVYRGVEAIVKSLGRDL